MQKTRKAPTVHGSWQANYHVETVATLNEGQADLLVGIPTSRDADIWRNWYGFEPRDLVVIIDYPLEKPIKLVVSAEEYTRASGVPSFGMFLLAVAREYTEIYKHPERYGIWGHGISDLYFERVTVGKDGTVELFIGS